MKTETSFYLLTKEAEKFLFKKDFLVPNLIQPYLEKDYPFVLINYAGNKYTIQNWEYFFYDDKTELKVYLVFLA